MKKLIATVTLILGMGGLIGLTAPAAQADDDDRKKRTWRAHGNHYTMILNEARDIRDDDALRATIKVNGKKKGKRYRVVITRSGKVVHRTTKRAGKRGNFRVSKRFRGDDDAWVKVRVKAVRGKATSRGMRLDD